MSKGNLVIVENDRKTALIVSKHVENCGFRVIDMVAIGSRAIQSTEHNPPDLVLMNINLDGVVDGIKAAHTIISKLNVPVVYISTSYDEALIRRAQFTNHSGIINTPLREVDLKIILNTAVNFTREKLCAADLVEIYKLTKTECSILMKLIKNPDIHKILDDFDITINTVRVHLKNIYRKTNSSSKSEVLMKVVNNFDCV